MPTPELFKYFPHDYPVICAHFYEEDIITLTSQTISFWTRPGGPESDYVDFKMRLDAASVDFVCLNDFAYVLGVDGGVTVISIDSSATKIDSPIGSPNTAEMTPFKVVKNVRFEKQLAKGLKIDIFQQQLFVLLSNGKLAVCPVYSLELECSTLYTVGSPSKLVTFALSGSFLFAIAKSDTKAFRMGVATDPEPYGYLSRDISKPDISIRNTTQIAFNGQFLVQSGTTGHFSLWKFDEEKQFQHIFTQWQHGSGITSVSVDFDKMVALGMDREGCGVIYSLRKSEVLERWVLHSGRVNSSQLRAGKLLTASDDYTAKIWLLWK